MPRPDFIGIGAPKCATSWLYNIFEIHPKVWIPPTKELHYFNQLSDQHSHVNRILLRKNNYSKSLNRLKYTPLSSGKWAYKYLFKKRSLNNYFNLFSPDRDQISGEITPTYASIDARNIDVMHHNLKETKFIYILRNPIYRDWSSTCMSYKNIQNKNLDLVSVDEIIFKATHPLRTIHSNYVSNLIRWENFFVPERFFIGFFDEIQNNPKQFLDRLFKFLHLPEIDYSLFDKLLYRRVNSFTLPIPQKVLVAIAKNELSNIKRIHQRFSNQYTASWVNEVESILSLEN